MHDYTNQYGIGQFGHKKSPALPNRLAPETVHVTALRTASAGANGGRHGAAPPL